jgi:hypothetical protein
MLLISQGAKCKVLLRGVIGTMRLGHAIAGIVLLGLSCSAVIAQIHYPTSTPSYGSLLAACLRFVLVLTVSVGIPQAILLSYAFLLKYVEVAHPGSLPQAVYADSLFAIGGMAQLVGQSVSFALGWAAVAPHTYVMSAAGSYAGFVYTLIYGRAKADVAHEEAQAQEQAQQQQAAAQATGRARASGRSDHACVQIAMRA